MSIEVHPVQNDREMKEFLQFPFALYRECPYWVPPLIREERATFDTNKNPALTFCRVRLFLARSNGQILGRVAAIVNDRANSQFGERSCRFGWLEAVDDADVWSALFNSVAQWARQQGMERLVGPMGFSNFDKQGMLIDGFMEIATMSAGFNFPYYRAHMERLGFEKDVDWVEYLIAIPTSIPEKVQRVQQLVLNRSDVCLIEPNKREMKRYASGVFDLLNASYAGLYGVVPFTAEQVALYVDEYIRFLRPELTKIVVNGDDEVVAFGAAMPSLVKGFQKANGKTFPFGWFHLVYAGVFARSIELLLVAVRPDYQAKGLPAILMNEITRYCIEHHFLVAESNPELEGNIQVQGLWKHFTARQHKRRRAYQRGI